MVAIRYPLTNRAERNGKSVADGPGPRPHDNRLASEPLSANFNLGQRRESNTLRGACLALSVRMRTEACDSRRFYTQITKGHSNMWPFSAFSNSLWLPRNGISS
jgi:hypothetical protein